MKILCVRVGDRYGPEYEEYLESKLPEHEFIWIREEMPNVQLQWNKMVGMNLDTDECICVMDIDILLLNDYKKIFEYPVERGQFLSIHSWWKDTEFSRFTINGGFYKYYPKDCKYIYDKFMENPEYYQRKYIEEGYTTGPVNGEQHFVEDAVNEKLELIYLPSSWVCRFHDKHLKKLNTMYKEETGNPYMYLGEFHSDIKFAHFTHMDNLPHLWGRYELFV